MTTQKAIMGSGAWKKVRLRVLARDGYVCVYCGGEATQVDHKVARVVGGQIFDLDNLQAICASCNYRKGSKPEAVFLQGMSTPPASQTVVSPMTVASTPKQAVATLNEPDHS